MDGFETFPEAWYSVHPARQRFLADLPAYRRDVRALADARAAEDSSSGSVDGAYHREALLGQIEMIRRAGVEPVLVIPPTLRPVPTLLPATAASEPPRLLAFNDPDAHPELFAEALRLDREHLTAEGTECFSRSLAAAFEARVMAGVEPAGRGHGEL